MIRVTDIAQALSLSKMTVSRALRGEDSVAAPTRERVLAKAAELGYRPDPVLSALVAYRHGQEHAAGYSQIAFVTNFPPRSSERWGFVRAFFHGAVARGKLYGYEVVEFPLREQKGRNQREASEILFHRGVKGVIVAPLTSGRGHLNLAWGHFAPVAIGYSLAKPQLHYVAFDHHHAVRSVMHELRKRGYRRIGFVHRYYESARIQHQALDAYLGEQYRFPRGPDIPPLSLGELPADTLWTWLAAHRPDAIVTGSNLASDIIADPRFAEYRQRHALGIVCWARREIDPLELAGIVEDWGEVGAAAVDRVHAQLRCQELGIPRESKGTLLRGAWHEGESLRAEFGWQIAD